MINKRIWALGIFMSILGGYGFSETLEEAYYQELYEKITGNFGVYESYLSRNKLIQLEAIRRTLREGKQTFELNHILMASKSAITECDQLVLRNLRDRLVMLGQKYQKIQDPQFQEDYAAFSKKYRDASELTAADMEEIANFIYTIDHTVEDLYVQANLGNAPAPGSAPQRNARGDRYLVREGDFLRKIAEAEYGDEMKWGLIYRANPDIISNPDLIYPGTEFVLP